MNVNSRVWCPIFFQIKSNFEVSIFQSAGESTISLQAIILFISHADLSSRWFQELERSLIQGPELPLCSCTCNKAMLVRKLTYQHGLIEIHSSNSNGSIPPVHEKILNKVSTSVVHVTNQTLYDLRPSYWLSFPFRASI